ncbi:MAG: hypothetical protein QXI58_02445, partial [Candidatus Micrarchaeia archaeon]
MKKTDYVKAAVMEGIKKIEIRQFPYPTKLPEDALIVKVQMSGVCSSERHIYFGRAPGTFP